MTVQQISIDNLFDDYMFNELCKNYELESKVSTISISINPNRDIYKHLEDSGVLDCIGCYYKDKLVGFMTIITSIVKHYSATSTVIESQFVLKEYRKYGAWNNMMKLAEQIAKDKGSFVIVMTSAIGTRFEKVANRSGYTATNIMYTKGLV